MFELKSKIFMAPGELSYTLPRRSDQVSCLIAQANVLAHRKLSSDLIRTNTRMIQMIIKMIAH